MEPNENNTMNLGGNIPQNGFAQPVQNAVQQQAQAQVVQQTTTCFTPENPTNMGVVTNMATPPQMNMGAQFVQQPQVNIQPDVVPVQNQNVNVENVTITEPTTQPVNNVVQQMTSQVVEQPKMEESVQTQESVQELVPSEDIIISVKELKDLVSRCKKVALNEPLIPLSGIFYLVIDKNGFSISADNMSHTITTVNKARSYNKEVKMCVDSAKFGDLVMNLSEGMVKIEYDENTHVLTLLTDSGYFKFTEKVDSTSGTSITIKHRFTQDYDTMASIKINQLKDTVNKTKPIRAASGDKKLQCVYFGDIVLCSDGVCIFMQDGIPSLKDTEFFVDSKTADLFSSIDFQEDKARVGIVSDEAGTPRAIILDDSYTVLSVRTFDDPGLPVDVCKNFWSKTFPDTVTLNTAKCVEVLSRAVPFIEANSDKEFAEFNIVGDSLTLSTLSGYSKETTTVTNTQNKSVGIKLPVKKMLGVLQTISDATYDFTTNPEIGECACLSYGNYKCVVAAG